MYCSSVRSSGTWLLSIPTSAAMTFLPMSRAASISDLHQLDASHSLETSARTTSQRQAAFCSASFQRWPATMPRSGSRSRKTSSQPFFAEPVADLDGFVVIAARVTDEKARHGLKRRSSNDLQLDRKSAPDKRFGFNLPVEKKVQSRREKGVGSCGRISRFDHPAVAGYWWCLYHRGDLEAILRSETSKCLLVPSRSPTATISIVNWLKHT